MDNLNVNDIISSLSQDDINMLKGVASSILGGEAAQNNNTNNAPPSSQEPDSNNSLAPQNFGFDNIDFDMIMKAKTIFEKMNSTHSKNADLIMALKPHLSPEIQNKADQAVRILKLFEILPLLREMF